MIDLSNLCKTYRAGGEDLPVLTGIDLQVQAGEYVALMGSSGSGKTTLMNLLGSLDRPSTGRYQMAGIDVSSLSPAELAVFRNQYVGFVFQNFHLLPRMSALDNVLLPVIYSTDGRSRAERVAYAKELLTIVGLAGRMHHAPNQLSGGERQRVAIARSLINRPKLLLADEPTGNLDSKTEQEILQLFRQLNQLHDITLVVVTHDAAVAEQANRVVHIRDGVISDDVRQATAPRRRKPKQETTDNEAADSQPAQVQTSTSHATRHGLNVNRGPFWTATLNAIVVATLALQRNALRTLLTMIGVVIGVSSVVMVMELSNGSSMAIRDTVASMGASMLTVSTINRPSTTHRRRYVPLTPDDVTLIADRCPDVELAAPMVHAQVQLVRRGRRWRPVFAFGTSPSYLEARNWSEMDAGVAFTDRHVRDAAAVCVIGQTVARELFGDEYPVGQEIRCNGISLRITGVLAPKGGDVIGNDQDDTIIAPWSTFKHRLSSANVVARHRTTFAHQMPPMRAVSFKPQIKNEHLHQIYVRAISPAAVDAAREQIAAVLSKQHNVDRDVIQINDMTEVSRVTTQVVSGLSALGLLIGGVSLLVGGVGIMNIMLVSVTERTREIGLRMAVGANRQAIMRQFLIESMVLCLAGGCIGIVVGHICSSIASHFMGWPVVPSLTAPIVAVTVAVLTGVIFGYYPARTASRLDPIDALRHE